MANDSGRNENEAGEDARERLKRLRASLEDLEEALSFTYTYSSAHIGGGQRQKDEECLRTLREEVAVLEQMTREEPPVVIPGASEIK